MSLHVLIENNEEIDKLELLTDRYLQDSVSKLIKGAIKGKIYLYILYRNNGKFFKLNIGDIEELRKYPDNAILRIWPDKRSEQLLPSYPGIIYMWPALPYSINDIYVNTKKCEEYLINLSIENQDNKVRLEKTSDEGGKNIASTINTPKVLDDDQRKNISQEEFNKAEQKNHHKPIQEKPREKRRSKQCHGLIELALYEKSSGRTFGVFKEVMISHYVHKPEIKNKHYYLQNEELLKDVITNIHLTQKPNGNGYNLHYHIFEQGEKLPRTKSLKSVERYF